MLEILSEMGARASSQFDGVIGGSGTGKMLVGAPSIGALVASQGSMRDQSVTADEHGRDG